MTLDEACIFCRIIRGQVPSFQVFENDRSLAFMDINPANPGHVLVIPKVHAESLFSLDEPWITATTLVAQRVARAVQKAFDPYGINIVQANGAGAAQSVPHFHWHVLPRAKNDGLPMNWQPRPGNREDRSSRGAHPRRLVTTDRLRPLPGLASWIDAGDGSWLACGVHRSAGSLDRQWRESAMLAGTRSSTSGASAATP